MLKTGPRQFPTISEGIIQLQGNTKEKTFRETQWKTVDMSIDWVANPNSHWAILTNNKDLAENFYFDSSNPKIIELKKQAIRWCKDKSIKNCLEIISEIINQLTDQEGMERSDVEKDLDNKLKAYIAIHKDKNRGFIDLAMEDLIDQKLLVCRHKAPLSAYLLGILVAEGILPPGIVRQYRTFLFKKDDASPPPYAFGAYGAHAWSLYRDKTTGILWLCDPRWATVEQVTNETMPSLTGYGEDVLNKMIDRMDAMDGLQPFADAINYWETDNLLKPAHITKTNSCPALHLRVEFKSKDKYYAAFQQSLDRFGLTYAEGTHITSPSTKPNPFLVIEAKDNPNLFSANFDTILNYYRQQLTRKSENENNAITPLMHLKRMKAQCTKKGGMLHKLIQSEIEIAEGKGKRPSQQRIIQ